MKFSIVLRFIEVGFLVILKRYIFAQLVFSQFISAIAQYALNTSKTLVLRKEES